MADDSREAGRGPAAPNGPDSLDLSGQTINAIRTGDFDPSVSLAFPAARFFALRALKKFS